VSGGRYNVASGDYSFAGGGGGITADSGNKAFSHYSAVLGGSENIAGDPTLTDHTIGEKSSVSGGYKNSASGLTSSVGGGEENTASGLIASVSGGYMNEASGPYSSVSGGWSNEASGQASSVSGGYSSTASGTRSSVSGGLDRNVTGMDDWRAGTYFSDN